MDRGARCAIQSIGSQRVGHESTKETVLPLNSHGGLPIFMFFYFKNFFTCILQYLFLTALRLVALGFLDGSLVKSLTAMQKPSFNPWAGEIPWRRKWQPIPVFLPGELHGQRNLAGYNPWGHKESDTTEWFSVSLSHRLTLVVKNLPANPRHEARVRALGQEDPLEKDMALYSNILAWRIPWTEVPGYSP